MSLASLSTFKEDEPFGPIAISAILLHSMAFFSVVYLQLLAMVSYVFLVFRSLLFILVFIYLDFGSIFAYHWSDPKINKWSLF